MTHTTGLTTYLRGVVGDFLKILARLTTLFVRIKWMTTCVRTRTRVWSPVIIPPRRRRWIGFSNIIDRVRTVVLAPGGTERRDAL
jgi:hypothetical protein